MYFRLLMPNLENDAAQRKDETVYRLFEYALFLMLNEVYELT